MAVKSKRLRFEILKRDGFRCRYCGSSPDRSELHVDHVHPESKGGQDIAENLVTACQDCNGGKSDILLTDTDKRMLEKTVLDLLRHDFMALDIYKSVWRGEYLNEPFDWSIVSECGGIGELLDSILLLQEAGWVRIYKSKAGQMGVRIAMENES